MIKMLRIDDRLLHGQVVFMWTKHLGVKGIIVANDDILDDPIQLVAVKLAVPEDMKLLIKKVDDAIKVINDPRGQNMSILVVVKDPIDAARLMKGINDPSQIAVLNIGNSGRIEKKDKKVLTKEVYVDDHDVAALQELLTYQIPFEIQMVPTNNKINVKDALKHFKEE